MKTQSRSTVRTAGASGLAAISMLLALSTSAGIIQNSNQDRESNAFKGDCGVVGEPTSCVGGRNLGNVDVNLKRADGSPFGFFNKSTGEYTPMTYGDYFESLVRGFGGEVMAVVTSNAWPVGEPTAIKAVVDDPYVTNGKPVNCIINTAFLGPQNSTVADANYLDSAHPQPVICSSPFQAHKRFNIAMQPALVDDVSVGKGKAIDLVFNVAEDATLKSYQVFSTIKNYTGKRLDGYMIIIGTGVGIGFRSASDQGLAEKLFVSLGIDEGGVGEGAKIIYDGSNLFDADSLASFGRELFGAAGKQFSRNGFFDIRAAGFKVEQDCTTAPAVPCPTYDFYTYTLVASDTIYSTGPMESNYHGPAIPPSTAGLPFGEWLPSIWQPQGIFFDDDKDPTTEALLVAWWDGATWRGNYDSGFKPFTQQEINWFAEDPNDQYALDNIEEVLSLDINYIIKVGDGIPDGKFTVRIIPLVAANQAAPAWCDPVCKSPPFGNGGNSTPVADPDPIIIPEPPLPPVYEVPVESSGGGSGGGGCSVSNGGRFDPILPAVLCAGLALLAWRRHRSGD